MGKVNVEQLVAQVLEEKGLPQDPVQLWDLANDLTGYLTKARYDNYARAVRIIDKHLAAEGINWQVPTNGEVKKATKYNPGMFVSAVLPLLGWFDSKTAKEVQDKLSPDMTREEFKAVVASKNISPTDKEATKDNIVARIVRHEEAAYRQAHKDLVGKVAEQNGRQLALGYARELVGDTNCSYCVMLAGRGPVYKSKYLAGENNRFHDRCNCRVVLAVRDMTAKESIAQQPGRVFYQNDATQKVVDACDSVREIRYSENENIKRRSQKLREELEPITNVLPDEVAAGVNKSIRSFVPAGTHDATRPLWSNAKYCDFLGLYFLAGLFARDSSAFTGLLRIKDYFPDDTTTPFPLTDSDGFVVTPPDVSGTVIEQALDLVFPKGQPDLLIAAAVAGKNSADPWSVERGYIPLPLMTAALAHCLYSWIPGDDTVDTTQQRHQYQEKKLEGYTYYPAGLSEKDISVGLLEGLKQLKSFEVVGAFADDKAVPGNVLVRFQGSGIRQKAYVHAYVEHDGVVSDLHWYVDANGVHPQHVAPLYGPKVMHLSRETGKLVEVRTLEDYLALKAEKS